MKKYLISGVGPSGFGVGRLLENLTPLAKNKSYTVISKFAFQLKPLLRRKKYGKALLIIAKALIQRSLFKIRIANIRNAEIVLLHPQEIGFKSFIKLIKENKKVKMFVMDNSFFCIESYNYDKKLNTECLKCLRNSDKIYDFCKSFPVKYKKTENLMFLESLKPLSSKINFYVQNHHQQELLKKHFGEDIKTNIIGMHPGEITISQAQKHKREPHLIVYHGSLDFAKGLKYIINLSEKLIDYKILIPYAFDDVKNVITELNGEIENILFKPMRWTSGLKEYVEKAAIVLNPSLWSAPVEGALLKSIAYNGNVAVYDTEYGFQREIPDNAILRLNSDINLSADKIIKHIESRKDFREQSQLWLKHYLDSICMEKMFD